MARVQTRVHRRKAERVRNVKAGSTVDIHYRTEAKQKVATAVTVVLAKHAASVPGPHQ
jgi:hypothetical protein